MPVVDVRTGEDRRREAAGNAAIFTIVVMVIFAGFPFLPYFAGAIGMWRLVSVILVTATNAIGLGNDNFPTLVIIASGFGTAASHWWIGLKFWRILQIFLFYYFLSFYALIIIYCIWLFAFSRTNDFNYILSYYHFFWELIGVQWTAIVALASSRSSLP
jgi:hypothetical protein